MKHPIDVRYTDTSNFPVAMAIQKNQERAQKIRSESPHLTIDCKECGWYALAEDAERSPYADKEIGLGFAESRLAECIGCKRTFYISSTGEGGWKEAD